MRTENPNEIFFLEMDSRKQQHPEWLRWQDGNKGEINVAAIIKDLRMEGRAHHPVGKGHSK